MIKVTEEDIIKMNELYLELKTYAAVARATGFSASTVKKYIQKDFISIDKREIKHFTEEMIPKEIDLSFFKNVENFGDLCVLTPEEKERIKELRGELEI